MTAGLPGTGIGGLFYLISALWMPFHESIELLRGRSHSAAGWAVIWTQTAIALAICFAIWFTGWSLALALTSLKAHSLASHVVGADNLPRNLVGPMLFVIAAATLLANLAIVHVARLFLWISSSDAKIIDVIVNPGASGEVLAQSLARETDGAMFESQADVVLGTRPPRHRAA